MTMADEPTTPPATPDEPETPKIAGKYADEDAFAKGLTEVRNTLGLKTGEKVFGEGGEYASVEAAEAAYRDLAILARGKQTPPPAEPLEIKDPPPAAEPDDDALGVQEIVAKAGLDLEKLQQSYLDNGKLSDEEYAALKKARPGFTRKMIDDMAHGEMAKAEVQKAEYASIQSEAVQIVGSKEGLDALLANARTFTPAEEIEDIRERLKKRTSFRGALRDLMDHHSKSVSAGKSAPLVTGTTTPATGGGAANPGEWSQLMKRASNGDPAAIAKIHATPDHVVAQWASQATA